MASASRLVVLLSGALAVLPASGCKSRHDSDETPSGMNAPSQAVLVAQGEFRAMPPSKGGNAVVGATMVVPFTSSLASSALPKARAQVDWTLPNDTVVIGIYAEGCTASQLGAGACTALAEGARPYAAAAESVANLFGIKPGKYVLGIRNFGPHAEFGAYQVVVSF